LDDPPAPAAREELGLETCDAPARRLKKFDFVREATEFVFRKTEQRGVDTNRIWAPGGLATTPVEERETAEGACESESD
jgi:hypothetical protein